MDADPQRGGGPVRLPVPCQPGAADGETYTLVAADNASFDTPDVDVTLLLADLADPANPDHTLTTALAEGTQYWWKVTAANGIVPGTEASNNGLTFRTVFPTPEVGIEATTPRAVEPATAAGDTMTTGNRLAAESPPDRIKPGSPWQSGGPGGRSHDGSGRRST